jgi:hypothetical protein
VNTINWILVISTVAVIGGFSAFSIEILRGSIRRRTRWTELNSYQLTVAVLAYGGSIVFMGTLIVGTVFRS